MSSEPARIAERVGTGLSLERMRPIRFTLDGQVFAGFAGDTVLSALLAAGVDTAGNFAGHPLALSHRFAPAVVPAKLAADPAAAVPMARMPAVDGAELVTPGRPLTSGATMGRLKQLLGKPGRSLGLKFERPGEFVEPWRSAPAAEALDADVLVIGGGVAGMNAALSAAGAGRSVRLVERRPYLGGDAAFYGTVDDEEPPEAMIARLVADIAAQARITVHLSTEAMRLMGGLVELHGCAGAGTPHGRRLSVRAMDVVLATGAFERLPVFAGNRHPGVAGALTAYHELRRYALWPGHTAVVSTESNFAYRLALQANEAGIAISRIADTRLRPQSRFIDFCKASGITLASGLVPQSVAAQQRGRGIVVAMAGSVEGMAAASSLEADRLVVAGGWQPDLTLWCRAGGQSRWNGRIGRLEPLGRLGGIALVGSAAGLRNNGACAASGIAAAMRMLGRPEPVIDDTQIEAIYETPDAPTPLVPVAGGKSAPAFLDAGPTLMQRPAPAEPGLVARLLQRPPAAWSPLDEGHALALCDLVAAVQLGVVDGGAAGTLARERCVAPTTIDTGHVRLGGAAPASLALPAYLSGRFGDSPAVWTVLSDDSRFFEPGCLVFADPADVDPAKAIGAIVAPVPGGRSGGLALIGSSTAAAGQRFTVRDENGAVSVRLMQPFPGDPPRPAR